MISLTRWPKVYVEIRDSSFLIGKLRKKKDRFYCDWFEESLLNYAEVRDGIINNPSAIYLLVERFLQKHNLRGAQAIVCAPQLSRYMGPKRKLVVLQISLCVCKAGLKIYKLLDQPLLGGNETGVEEQIFPAR